MPSQLRTLLAGGETLTVEFKRASINDAELVEAVVCLANAKGGQLLLGVEDDGTVTGLDPGRPERREPERLAALITSRTEPPVVVEVELLATADGEVAVVTTPASSHVVATSNGRYLRRALDLRGKPTCLPMRPHEILARASSIGLQDYALTPLRGVEVVDLDPVELSRFRGLARERGDRVLGSLSDEDLLKALNLVSMQGEFTLGALLLFGQEAAIARHAPAHGVAFHELERLQIRTQQRSRVPLFRAMDELASAINQRNPEEEIQVGMFRVGVPRFGQDAIRELVANALIHRDFTLLGEVVVEVNERGLLVSNPGGFPEGVTLDNLLVTPPRPRNPVLADAFQRAGLVDRTSRGIDRAFASQLRIGRSAPDYTQSTTNAVVVRVDAGPPDIGLAALVAELNGEGDPLDLDDLLALHEVRAERRITTARAATVFQKGVDASRLVLNRLVDRGLLEVRGDGRGRTYHLSAAMYRRLGDPVHYVRVRGFDRLQQEQMVMTYVERHGRITRREVSDLCQLDSEQASRLLRRLRDDGRLEMSGTKRTAEYRLPGVGA